MYDFHVVIFHFMYVVKNCEERLVKMDDLKSISLKQFNEFIKGKGFKERDDYKLKVLKARFGFGFGWINITIYGHNKEATLYIVYHQ